MAQVMKSGGKGQLEHSSDRRSSGGSLATFVASTAQQLWSPRRRTIAYANLADISENEPAGECKRAESRDRPRARETDDVSPADRNDGLSLPARAWLIVGAAGALWALATLIYVLLS